MTRQAWVGWAAFTLSCCLGAPLAAEEFELTTGGRITGEIVNKNQSPRRTFVIKTATGVQVTLNRAAVRTVRGVNIDQREYARMRPRYPDTVEAEWALAEWCHKHRLVEPRKTHLKRIIELDPDHQEARRLLGYQKTSTGWMTKDEINRKRGLTKVGGRWLTAQQIELMERERKTKVAQGDWAQKLRRWRNWLGTQRDGEGRRNIVEIKDPFAVKTLDRLLKSDNSPQARVLYIEALANIGSPAAIQSLAIGSMHDLVEEVRLTCLDHLEKVKDPDLTAYYVGQLRSKHNFVINRAAICLGRLSDPSSIGPLIDSLVTTHKYRTSNGSPGGMTMSFPTGGSRGPTGMSMGSKPTVITQNIRNQTVLDVLVLITKKNFNFNEQAWHAWHATQRKVQPSLDARRD